MKLSLLLTAILGCSVSTASCAQKSLTTSQWNIQSTTPLSTPRAAHKATMISPLLVLVTGGCSNTGCTPVEPSAELIHIESGRSEAMLPMSEPRASHVAAPLRNGKVLVAGGWTGNTTTASADVFDPQTHTFSPVKSMATPRMDATATPLLDGLILVAGGATATNQPTSKAEIFNHIDGRFSATDSMREARVHHTAIRLNDGRVLLVGGLRGRNLATNSAEIYDPSTGAFTTTGSMQQARCKHGAVKLKDGRVMVIAGSTDCGDRHRIAQTEIYDPRTGQFTTGPSLQNPRYKIADAASVLPSGVVVVSGDANDVETWTPGTHAFVKANGNISAGLAFSTATVLPNGSVLVLGGYDNDIRVTAQAWIVNRINSVGNPH